MTQPADWYTRWATAHCEAFGFRDENVAAVLAWRGVFAELFTADELHAATRRLIAGRDLPPFADRHRAALIAAVEAERSARRRAADALHPPPVCQGCSGTGVFIVPHPGVDEVGRIRPVLAMPKDDPRGLTRTASVCCWCDAGTRTHDATAARGLPLMRLARFEQLYPNWRDVQFAREQVLAAGRQATATAADVQKLTDELARRSALPKAG